MLCVCGFIHPTALETPEGFLALLREVSLTTKGGKESSDHRLPLRAGEDYSHLNPGVMAGSEVLLG